jgi:GTP-binding protein
LINSVICWLLIKEHLKLRAKEHILLCRTVESMIVGKMSRQRQLQRRAVSWIDGYITNNTLLHRHSSIVNTSSHQMSPASRIIIRAFGAESSASKARKQRQFVDKVTLHVNGGRGGNGCLSYEVQSPSKRRPSGGNGGKGGSVYIIADSSVVDLSFETTTFNGGPGGHGSRANMTGRNGRDIIIRVPVGTLVSDVHQDMTDDQILQEVMWADDEQNAGDGSSDDKADSDEPEYKEFTQEQVDAVLAKHNLNIDKQVFDLSEDQMTLLAVEGGQPGLGNANVVGQGANRKSVPQAKMPGQAGQRRALLLELKMIADVGLVGFPNVR